MNYDLEMARWTAAEAERKLESLRRERQYAQDAAYTAYMKDSNKVDRAQDECDEALARLIKIKEFVDAQNQVISSLKNILLPLQKAAQNIPAPNTPIDNSQLNSILKHNQQELEVVREKEKDSKKALDTINNGLAYNDIEIDAELAAHQALTMVIINTITGQNQGMPYTKNTSIEEIECINKQQYHIFYDIHLQSKGIPANDPRYKDYSALIAHQAKKQKRGIFQRLFRK
ncbi:MULTISPECIES: hypothetical protein [Acetobacter]|uniref:hypothetical protein n=1 Tax=Acetobacter TaxID=434 RepID=UPI000A399EBE|nr:MULTISPECIES: hypothetical protein [Acetobacter]MBS1003504.1 hypothetical protein [Acetobacter thailandicus]OUJ09164.1 hypothetical protein HK25_12035 [Acetobacter sp. DsW_059]